MAVVLSSHHCCCFCCCRGESSLSHTIQLLNQPDAIRGREIRQGGAYATREVGRGDILQTRVHTGVCSTPHQRSHNSIPLLQGISIHHKSMSASVDWSCRAHRIFENDRSRVSGIQQEPVQLYNPKLRDIVGGNVLEVLRGLVL